MARTVGKVKSISGKAAVKTLNDQLHVLKVGEALHENEMVYALGADSKVTLTLEGGRELTLNGYDEILLDKSVFATLEEGEALDLKALQQALAEGEGNLEETAAGQETVGEANAGAEYADRNDARGNPNSYLTGTDNNALGVTFDALQNENFAPEAFDDSGNAIEEGSGDDYDAPVVATGNVLGNDTDDLLPNPPSDLDVTAVTSNNTSNATNFVGGFFVIEGQYGTLVLNSETGEYTYTVDESNPTVNAMNIGDNIQESFSYIVNDGALEDSAVLTITIAGSNDAPIATGEGGYALNVDSDAALTNISSYPTEGAAVKFIVETQAGESVTFNWQFNATDYLPYNDFAFVGVDNGNLQLLSNVSIVGDYGSSGLQTFSFTFTEGGAHTITFGTANTYDTSLDPLFTVTYQSGGTVLDVLSLGHVTQSGEGWSVTAEGASVNDLNSFLDTDMTIGGLIDAMEGNEADAAVAAEGNVLLNDTDVDNLHEQLSVISVNGESVPQSEGTLTYQGMYGILEMDAKGNFTYTPFDAESETEGASAVNALNIGDILEETFTYIISDNEEGGAKTDTAVLRVTINGTNDAPVATADYGTSYEGNESDDAIPAEGNVLGGDYDVDNTNLRVVSVNDQEVSEEGLHIEGIYGVLVINANGSYTYTPYAPDSGYENAANTDALSAGEQQHDIFTYTISDNEPGVEKFATGTLDITITGTNDQPIVSNVSGTATETDGTQTFNGQLTLIDPDAGDTHTFQQTGTATVVASNETVQVTNFSVAVDPDGGYHVNGNFDALAAGETATVTFTYTATDDSGTDNATSDAKIVTLTVSGTNDQPVVSDVNVNGAGITGEVTYTNDTDYSVYDYHTTLSTIEITDSGSIQDLNVQINLTHSWDGDLNIRLIAPDGRVIGLSSYNGGSGNNYTNTVFDDEAITAITSGSAPFNGIYRPEELLSTIDGLEMKGTWTLQISDDAGADSGALYSWSLIIDADSQTYIYESNGVDTIYTGTLTDVTDLDTSDTHTFQLFGTATVETESGAVITDLGVTVAPSGIFTVNGNFDALAEGETATVTFQYVANDGKGFDGTDGMNESSISEPKTVTLTVTGTNDAPVATADYGTSYEGNETDDAIPAEGNVLGGDYDVDSTNLSVISVNGQNVSAGEPLSIAGAFGTLVIASDGSYTYTPYSPESEHENAGLIDALNEGETLTESFTYTISDNESEGAKTDSATLTLTIEGTNDAPVAEADIVAISEERFWPLYIDVMENDDDVDSENVSLINAEIVEGNGWVTISNGLVKYYPNWFDNQSLYEGETKSVIIEYTIADDMGKEATSTLTVNISGMNDHPVAVLDFASGDENQIFVMNVLSNDWDVDSEDNPSNFSLDTISYYGLGTASIVENQLQFDPGTAFDYLNVGEKATVSIWYKMSDDSGADSNWSKAIITLVGSNDKPVALEDAVFITEDRLLGVSINVLANDSDVDSDHLSVINAQITEGDGYVTISHGMLKYYPDWFDNQSLNEGDIKNVLIEYTIKDEQGATATSTVSVTITGVNDYPVAVVDFATGDENHLFSVNVLANDWDVDSGDNPSNFQLIAINYSGPGTASIVGNQLQFAPGTAFDYLNVGEKATVNIWYKMSDDSGAQSDWTLATLKLHGSNDGPVAVDDFTVASYSTYSIDVNGNEGWDGVTITAIGGNLSINPGNGKLGVYNGPGDSHEVDNKGTDEAIKFEFENMLQHAEVILSSFNTAQNDNDTIKWTAMLGTSIVASGSYSGGSHSTLIIDTGASVFDTLIIGTPIGEKTDFFIEALTGYGLEINSALTVTENEPIVIAESYLMANDSDVDSDTLNIINIDSSGTIGEVSIDANGNVTYDPAGRFDHLGAGEIGTDTFTYVLSDGSATDTATVTINIIGSSGSADSNVNIDLDGCLTNYNGGDGYDTINLLGSTLVYHNPHHGHPGYYTDNPIDFNTLSSKFDNIEHIDLKDGGKTVLNVTPENVVEMTDSDNFLRISGETDDRLQLKNFTLDSDTSANLDGYNAYVGSFGGEDIVLHIDSDINIIP